MKYVQIGYYALLPYLALTSIFLLGSEAFVSILFGWVVLLVYQILFLGLLFSNTSSFQPTVRWLFFIPPLLVGGKQAIANGSIWNFFIEEMILEAVVLMLVFIGQLFFTRNSNGRTAWQDLGIIPLLVAGILVAGMWDFGKTWWSNNVLTNRPDWLAIAVLGAAFAVAFFNYWRAISDVRMGRRSIRDVFSDDGYGIALIIGQIVLWTAGGFVLRAFLG